MSPLFFALFLTITSLDATCASDGSASSVQTCINSVAAGDTVTLPVGTFTWSTPVTLNKAVKIKGKGSGRIYAWGRSSQTFGTGTKTWTVQTGFNPPIGTILRVWETATDKDSTYMLGAVTSISGTTLTMNITTNTGSGSATLWLFATEAKTKVIHSASSALIPITETTTGSPEISGIQFSTSGGSGAVMTFNYTSGGQPILIHDCWFWNNGAGIRVDSTNRGVIWNVSVAWPVWAQSDRVWLHMPINPRTEVWAGPSTMGTSDTDGKHNIYVEDSDFHGAISTTDSDTNSKLVWRKNVNDHAGLNSHGYDTGIRGARHWEVYNNQFLFANVGNDSLPLINHMLFRGGTGAITGNYIEDITSQPWGNKQELQFGVWNLGRWSFPQNCIGSPPICAYDADDGCVPHYPSPNQFGFGYVTGTGVDGQVVQFRDGIYVGDTEPAYIWANTGFTPVIDITTDGQACTLNKWGHVPDDPNDYIQVGRDYKLQPKPGYVKFTYPHPLRQSFYGD